MLRRRCWEGFPLLWDRKGQVNPQGARRRAGNRVEQADREADPETMAKLVECVPNFSEGNNKEVREHMEWLGGG